MTIAPHNGRTVPAVEVLADGLSHAAVVNDVLAAGTRAYNLAQGTRTATAAASTAAVAFGTLGASREVMLTATERCFVAIGASDVAAADGTAATVLPIEAGEKFHLQLAAGVTHYRVIRDTTDGILRTIPVV